MMSPIRVLLVEDYKPWLSFVSTLLEKEPAMSIVGVATDGEEAVAKAHSLEPDLVLMDIGLPTLNGIEAARRIVRSVTKAKIIYLTQHREPLIVQTAVAAGGKGYVVKVDAGAELLPAIEAVIQGKRYFSRGLLDFDLEDTREA